MNVRALVSLTTLVAALGCESVGVVDAPSPVPTTCDSTGDCSSCANCFDTCLCGGGTSRRCAEECSTAPPTDGGSSMDAPFVGTFISDAVDIPPNSEYFRCQNFSNPFGQDVAVLSTDSFMTAGSHHMFAFEVAGVHDAPMETCQGTDFFPYLHLAQRSEEHITYPPGVGHLLSASNGVRLQIHYLNVSSDTVHAEIALTVRAAKVSDVPTLAGQIFANTLSINVPPHSPGSSVHSCSVPKDVNVFSTASHMHQHGTFFTARASDGQLLFETNEWAEPAPWTLSPVVHLHSGSSINVDCEYQNTTSYPLNFGPSAATNEMCIFVGMYYPAAPGDSITCLF